MYKITKEFDFCYGHRVWSQELDIRLSLDNKCVCRHLHGHQGKIIIELSSSELKMGMTTDFKHLNWFKKFVDDVIDHKFIIDEVDPLFSVLIPSPNKDIKFLKNEEYHYSSVDLNLRQMNEFSEPLKELYEGFIIVGFVPTSENISKWIFDIVTAKMNPFGIKVSSVEFKETPKTSATYIEPGSVQ